MTSFEAAAAECAFRETLYKTHANKVASAAKLMKVSQTGFMQYDAMWQAAQALDRSGRVLTKISNQSSFKGPKEIGKLHDFFYSSTHYNKVNDLTQLASLYLTCGRQHLQFGLRTLPILADMVHLQSRYTRRVEGTVIDYGKEEFAALIGTCLILSEITGDMLEKSNEAWMPIVVPEKNGLFLGITRAMDPAQWDKHRLIFANRAPGCRDGHFTDNAPTWRPKAQIILSSYVHMSNATPSNQAAYAMLQPFVEHPTFMLFTRFVYSYFQNGGHWTANLDPQYLQNFSDAMAKRMGNITSSAPSIRKEGKVIDPNHESELEKRYVVGHDKPLFEKLSALINSREWRAYAEPKRASVSPRLLEHAFG